MLRNKTRIFFTVSLLLICLFVGCGDDNPVSHSTPDDYVIYFYDMQNDMCFALHSATLLIDSFTLPVQPRGEITVSADGAKLYVPLTDNVSVIDLETKNILTELPYSGIKEIAVSTNNQYIALLGNRLHILSNEDYSLLYYDSTRSTESGVFSYNNNIFYFSTRFNLCRVNLSGEIEVLCKNFNKGDTVHLVYNLYPSVNDDYSYVINRYDAYDYYFAKYNFYTDSIEFIDYLTPGNGKIAITFDNNYVIYTNPGTGDSFEPEPSYEFKIFNTYTNEIEDVISTILVFNEIDTVKFPVDEICVTPDNKWLLGTSHDYNEIIIFDLKEREIEKQISLGWNRYFSKPTCQLQLKE